MPFAHWVHNLDPFLIQFTEEFGIRYYGLAYLAGFVAGGYLLYRYARAGRSRLPAPAIADFMTVLVLGVLVGGRLGHFLLYEPGQLFNPPWAFFQVWKGGMASHGGFLGVTIALWWFARAKKIPFAHLADLVASVTGVGLFFGRVANFINGELWGKVTNVPWAVIFSGTGGGPDPRHPSQLYEAALEGLLLLAFSQWRFWRSDVVRAQPGRLCGEFLIAYAVVRAIGEVFREPDASLLFGLSRGTFYSLFLVLAGVAFIVRGRATAAARGRT